MFILKDILVSFVSQVGATILYVIDGLGKYTLFVQKIFAWVSKPPFRKKQILEQIVFVGNQSLFLIVLSSSFTGMVMAYQTYMGFKAISADSFIGPVVAISLAKELGPVITGLIIAGRCGAAMAAQIGSMKVTEQIDALKVMGINPIQYLAVPRVIACSLVMPMLVIIFLVIGNLGSWLIGTKVLGIDSVLYFSKLSSIVKIEHVIEGLIKSVVFGFLISTIGTHQGFNVKGGADGVGYGTNMAVVWGMIVVLIVDFFLTSFLVRIL